MWYHCGMTMIGSTNVAAFERNLRAYVAQGSGLKAELVIPGNDRSPRPIESYATLLRVDNSRLAWPARRYDSGITTNASYRRNNYSLQFYRKGASDYALAFLVFVESEIGQTVAEDGGFEVVQQPPLTDERLDDVLGDDFEERVLINMPIDYIHVRTQDTGTIDQIEGDIIYGDQSITVAHP